MWGKVTAVPITKFDSERDRRNAMSYLCAKSMVSTSLAITNPEGAGQVCSTRLSSIRDYHTRCPDVKIISLSLRQFKMGVVYRKRTLLADPVQPLVRLHM